METGKRCCYCCKKAEIFDSFGTLRWCNVKNESVLHSECCDEYEEGEEKFLIFER